jgi:two-component system, OmpR family, sensor histidine kinase CiaH
MNANLIKKTRTQFVLVIMTVLLFSVVSILAVFKVVGSRQIGNTSSISEVHKVSKNSPELSGYIDSQAKYEAHFVSLAAKVKEQDQNKLTKILAVTAVASVLLGSLVAFFAAKFLMKPTVEAYNSQERFLQDAAHELRNPLATLTVALQQAKSEAASPELVKTFRRQTKRLVNINEDLLYLERNIDKPKGQVNVSELFKDIIEEIQPQARAKSVNVISRTEDDLFRPITSSEYVRLVKNVLDNAVKYSKPSSKVTIVQLKHKNKIEVVVSDDGIGMSKLDLSRLGERFYRGSNVGSAEGTGLGVSIIKKILTKYGGDFKVESRLGKGTKVSLTV